MTIRKIFLDSRFRISGTPSDFVCEFPSEQELPDDYTMWLAELAFPRSWLDINSTNSRFYYMIRDDVGQATAFYLDVPHQNIVRDQLVSDLDTTLSAIGVRVTLRPDETLLFEHETPGYAIRIPSPWELRDVNFRAEWEAAGGVLLNSIPRSFNQLVRTLEEDSSFASSVQCGIFVDSTSRDIYVTTNITNYDSTLDVFGRRNVLAHIPVTVAYGYVQRWQHSGLEAEGVNVGGLRFKNIRLTMQNIWGEPIDLRGSHVTATLLFGPSR